MLPIQLGAYQVISCSFLLAVAGALRRCSPLAVLALRHVERLATHPATTAKMYNLLPDKP